VVKDLFSDDISGKITKEATKVVRNVLKRNKKAVGPLKILYHGQCQVTGKRYVFKKTDGRLYCEAHHLTPLGEGGADLPRNLIIVSPLIHRMFHYADVSGLDPDRIVDNKLKFKINRKPFTITWHPKHSESVTSAKNPEKT
jgi:5-methylcytosine-specific restriction protein A